MWWESWEFFSADLNKFLTFVEYGRINEAYWKYFNCSWYGGGNSTTAEEVSRSQCLFPNTNWLKWKNRHQPVIHPWVLERVIGGGMPFHINQLGLEKRHWNLETSSAVVEFLYRNLKQVLGAGCSSWDQFASNLGKDAGSWEPL